MTYHPAPDRYSKMIYRRSGRSGLMLPAVSLGLWHNFGHDTPHQTKQAICRTAFDLGITHFDLANNYGPPPGSAEEAFGELMRTDFKDLRDELIISSKAGYEMWQGPYGEWGSRKYLIASCDQSLKRMGLDYVDIFYSHRFDPDTPLEETMGALDQIVRSGRALYAGISSYNSQRTREAYAILKSAINPTAEEFHQIFAEWNKGELNSYLIDITEQIFTKKDEETGKPLIDVILDKAGQKGTGKWTVGNAVEHAVVLSTVNAAVEARILSSMKEKRVAASQILPVVDAKPFTGDRQQFINDVRDALYASKIVSYAQGLDLLATAGKFYNWNLNFGDIATIWRGGCIIRAAFLNRIKEAYEANPSLENLMLAPFSPRYS